MRFLDFEYLNDYAKKFGYDVSSRISTLASRSASSFGLSSTTQTILRFPSMDYTLEETLASAALDFERSALGLTR
jgi:hypothetical protein